MDIIPIEEIEPAPSSAARAALLAADIVIGVDLQTQREFTVFGTPALESTTTLKKPSAMRVVRVSLDCNNRQLERLMARVRQVKGSEGNDGPA